MTKQIITTDGAPTPVGPYSQAIKADNWLYISGQIPIDPKTGELVEESFERQVRTVLDSITAILKAGGSDLDRVVKVTIFLADMNHFAELNAVYDEYFSASCPARACVEVSCLPKNVAVEIEAVAVCG